MRRDSNKYLALHNIKDGNLVETRKLDLRPGKNPVTTSVFKGKTIPQEKYNPVEKFLKMRIKDGKNVGNQKKIHFLNDTGESSESSDSSDDDDRDSQVFGIEKYRQQKKLAMEKNKL